MTTSLYRRLGGQRAVDVAVETLYRRVMADDQLAPFYAGVDLDKLMLKQKVFLTYAFGGLKRYPGRSIRRTHGRLAGMGLTDEHFDLMLGHLDATLDELGVAEGLKREVRDTVERTRKDVLGGAAVGAEPVDSRTHSLNPKGQQGATIMKRIAIFVYGVISYAIFFGTFCYAAGWVGNVFVPKGIDGPATAPFGIALLTNIALLGAFAIQHSVMARPTFKKAWTKIVPVEAERSTYTLFASIALIAMFWFWQPLGGEVWSVTNPAGRAVLYSLFATGWGLVLLATFQINHFDLFGLRQVWLCLRGKPYTRLKFGTPWLYRHVRHPLYLGFFIGFWSTPTMTITHLVFALVTSAYILVAIQLEERNLVDELPEYAEYRKHVPMLIPSVKGGKKKAAPALQPEAA